MRNAYSALIDVFYWPIVQLSVSAVLVRVPIRLFSSDGRITRIRGWEQSRYIYRLLGVARWKKKLPDAAFLVGGSKKRVNPYSRSDVSRFLSELRRAEIAHWVQLVFAVPCFFWNPSWASVVMTLYALCANIPCIAAQRYNRILLQSRPIRTQCHKVFAEGTAEGSSPIRAIGTDALTAAADRILRYLFSK